MGEQKVKVGKYVAVNDINYTLDCAAPLNTAQRNYIFFGMLQDNSSPSTGVRIVLYTW